MDVDFRISANEQAIGPACDFVYRWAQNYGLEEPAAARFTTAVSELITNIVLFAYPNENQANFEVGLRHTMTNVEVIVSEVGEPFDPDRHQYDPQKAIADRNFEGAGFRLIRSLCDKFLFINKGKEGKEFHLSKNVVTHDIDELIELSKAQRPVEPDTTAVSEKKLEPTSFRYDQIGPDDAENIAKLIYRTYGYSYSKEDLYFPKKIEETLLGEQKLGVIAKNRDGYAIGYFAVITKEDSNIAEIGEAVVSPNYRRRGVMSKMMEHLIEIGRDHNLVGLYGQAVTLHPVSQKVNYKYNFKTSALMLADTDNVSYKGFDEDYPQPVSVVTDFLPLQSAGEKTVFIPSEYSDFLLETYQEVGISVESKQPKEVRLAHKSEIKLDINYHDSTALLVVQKYGSDFDSVLTNMLESLREQENLNAIYLDLPLENSATPSQFKEIKKRNFIYCGLVPLFHNQEDYLRMQKINIDMDLKLIEVYSEFGQKIKSLVADEYY